MLGGLTRSESTGGYPIPSLQSGQRIDCFVSSHAFTVYAMGTKMCRFAGRPAFSCFTIGGMSDFETLTVEEVPDDAHILDVRDPYEFDAGHIPGAINIPLDQ